MSTSRGFAPLILIVIIGIVVLGGAWWWLATRQMSPVTEAPDITPEFSATPTTGSAPLSVNFILKANKTTGYSVDYDDGTPGANSMPSPDGPRGTFERRWSHTYSSPGTYTATLFRVRSNTEKYHLNTIEITVR